MNKITCPAFVLPGLIILGVFISIFGLSAFALHFQQRQYAEAERQILESKGGLLTQYMEFQLKKLNETAELLSVFATQPEDSANNFDILAQHVLQKNPMIRSIGFAPNGMIAKIFPLEYNENHVGTDLWKKHDELTNLARHNQKMMITGPLEFAPGKWGVKVFIPIFTQNLINQFWGFITLTIDLSTMFADNEIQKILGPDFIYRLGCFNSEQNAMSFFYQNTNLTALPSQQVFSHGLEGVWRLEVGNVQHKNQNLIPYLYAGLLSLALTVLSMRLLDQKHKAKILARYDRILGYPNRAATILKANKALTGLCRCKGASMVLLINTDDFSHTGTSSNSIQKLITNSLRPKDLLAPLDATHLMVVIGGLANSQTAQKIADKLFKKLISQRETTGIGDAQVKLGACIRRGKIPGAQAVAKALEALRSAQHQSGDILEMTHLEPQYLLNS